MPKITYDDYIGKEFTDITIEGYEDGEYYWETTQIYYFDKYDIKLDMEGNICPTNRPSRLAAKSVKG